MARVFRKQGGIGLVLFASSIITTLSLTALIFSERQMLDIKRSKIHNAVIAANLASYEAINQGNKNELLKFSTEELKGYISNPSTIPSSEVENIINIMSSEYFPKGERYKSIYINKENALSRFKEYLEKNLDVSEEYTNEFIPLENDDTIKKIYLQEFIVHNAIPNWDVNRGYITDELKDNPYTGIHIKLNAVVKNGIKLGAFDGETNVPIHIDTTVTTIRPNL